jgi:hypothetical protein
VLQVDGVLLDEVLRRDYGEVLVKTELIAVELERVVVLESFLDHAFEVLVAKFVLSQLDVVLVVEIEVVFVVAELLVVLSSVFSAVLFVAVIVLLSLASLLLFLLFSLLLLLLLLLLLIVIILLISCSFIFSLLESSRYLSIIFQWWLFLLLLLLLLLILNFCLVQIKFNDIGLISHFNLCFFFVKSVVLHSTLLFFLFSTNICFIVCFQLCILRSLQFKRVRNACVSRAILLKSRLTHSDLELRVLTSLHFFVWVALRNDFGVLLLDDDVFLNSFHFSFLLLFIFPELLSNHLLVDLVLIRHFLVVTDIKFTLNLLFLIIALIVLKHFLDEGSFVLLFYRG